MLENLPNFAMKKKNTFKLQRDEKIDVSGSNLFFSGMLEAEPTVLTPQEESKLMDRYIKSQGDEYPVGTIVGVGDHPVEATEEDLEKFKQKRDTVIPPMVKKDIKTKGGIFHGKHNLNREYVKRLGEQEAKPFIQETYDFDVWVGNPSKRADQMQKKLDNKMKCDIAYAVKQPAPHDSKARWIVRSRSNMENPEVDYVGYPDPIQHPYRTRKQGGIEYETMESSMAREEVLKNVPVRSFKARRSLYVYQKYKAYERNKKEK